MRCGTRFKKLLKLRTRRLYSIDSSRSNLLLQVLLHWKDGTLIGKGYNSVVECHLDAEVVISSSQIIPKPNQERIKGTQNIRMKSKAKGFGLVKVHPSTKKGLAFLSREICSSSIEGLFTLVLNLWSRNPYRWDFYFLSQLDGLSNIRSGEEGAIADDSIDGTRKRDWHSSDQHESSIQLKAIPQKVLINGLLLYVLRDPLLARGKMCGSLLQSRAEHRNSKQRKMIQWSNTLCGTESSGLRAGALFPQMRLATPTRAYEPISYPCPWLALSSGRLMNLPSLMNELSSFPGVLLFLPESAILYLIYKEPILSSSVVVETPPLSLKLKGRPAQGRKNNQGYIRATALTAARSYCMHGSDELKGEREMTLVVEYPEEGIFPRLRFRVVIGCLVEQLPLARKEKDVASEKEAESRRRDSKDQVQGTSGTLPRLGTTLVFLGIKIFVTLQNLTFLRGSARHIIRIRRFRFQTFGETYFVRKAFYRRRESTIRARGQTNNPIHPGPIRMDLVE
ncbi:hypothetical protein GOBAR_AA20435 [Gossypium barbadense]|uniref:Uncharacterized protein n=1 Tax=Gossypium barbadense TaxID=3634 RepID=A0A2P5XA87_GOSBA|nr:hypothetical protein GOBAR_AA20435 [Gossypium barbadense]